VPGRCRGCGCQEKDGCDGYEAVASLKANLSGLGVSHKAYVRVDQNKVLALNILNVLGGVHLVIRITLVRRILTNKGRIQSVLW
jgi:hypothetical protein